MFNHVKFGISDYAASKAFCLKALDPRGVTVVSEGRRPTVSSLACYSSPGPTHVHRSGPGVPNQATRFTAQFEGTVPRR
jgi:hypothetical protein